MRSAPPARLDEERPAAPSRLDGLRAITLDFGNTLVPVDRASLDAALAATCAGACARLDVADIDGFRRMWIEERDRQFREDVPRFLETDLETRAIRILARLHGLEPPRPPRTWDDAAAAARSSPEEVATIVDCYSAATIAHLRPSPDALPVLRRLRDLGYGLAILSNWPHAATIDRYAEHQGWTRHLDAIVVSQRVGAIKPHRRIFEVAAEALDASPPGLLHVGDDWAADVVGAVAAGWRAAYLVDHQRDTPLPTSARTAAVMPTLELDHLADLPARIAPATP